MKITKKELNEFPIGTKIYCGKDTILKADFDICNWRKMEEHHWIWSDDLRSYKIDKVEIPTYTEYIPPKPILDDKEKEYLSFVIRPWRNRVKYITKEGGLNQEFINIETDELLSVMLPCFKAGTMYKDMKLNRRYSLKELEL